MISALVPLGSCGLAARLDTSTLYGVWMILSMHISPDLRGSILDLNTNYSRICFCFKTAASLDTIVRDVDAMHGLDEFIVLLVLLLHLE